MRGGRVINQYYEIARSIVEFKGTWLHPFKILLLGKRSKKELKNRKKDLSKFLNKMGLKGRYKIIIYVPKPKKTKENVVLDEWCSEEFVSPDGWRARIKKSDNALNVWRQVETPEEKKEAVKKIFEKTDDEILKELAEMPGIPWPISEDWK